MILDINSDSNWISAYECEGCPYDDNYNFEKSNTAVDTGETDTLALNDGTTVEGKYWMEEIAFSYISKVKFKVLGVEKATGFDIYQSFN